jgi:hypothetical protein
MVRVMPAGYVTVPLADRPEERLAAQVRVERTFRRCSDHAVKASEKAGRKPHAGPFSGPPHSRFIMRATLFGLAAVAAIVFASAGTAKANHHHHGGYCAPSGGYYSPSLYGPAVSGFSLSVNVGRPGYGYGYGAPVYSGYRPAYGVGYGSYSNFGGYGNYGGYGGYGPVYRGGCGW